jgi:hypothetical protein
MDAWIYDGDIYCDDCKPDGAEGPYADGGGEADCPQHCGGCGMFLENPLTQDGYDYVREAIADSPSEITQLWADFYEMEEGQG